MIGALDGLVQQEGSLFEAPVGNEKIGASFQSDAIFEPLLKVALSLVMALLGTQIPRLGQCLGVIFINDDAVAIDVGEEGPPAMKLVVHIGKIMNDETIGVTRCAQRLFERQSVIDAIPPFLIGQFEMADDDQQVEIRPIA